MLRDTSAGLAHFMFVAVILAVTGTSASAQDFEKLAIGPQIAFHFPVNDELDSSVLPGLSYKIGRPRDNDGWGPDFGFGWFSADLASPLGGHLNVRPLLGGVGHTWVRGKYRTHVAALTGPAFVTIKVNDDERAAYSALLGLPVVGVDAKNA